MIKDESKNKYNHSEIEKKWQKKWLEDKIYQPDLDSATRPYYNLMMFPYPSAEGMHVGNMYAQTGGDIHGRLKRMQGHDVFQPMGLDGFGIHSENYALKVGSHPMDQAEKSEANFYRQMRETGSGFAWDNTVETWKEDYYKWTQWVFIQLFKAGLAYRAAVPVNFCPSCKTVLADEQVIQKAKGSDGAKGTDETQVGVCERCDTPVEKRDLEQWMFRITSYAEQLLEGLDRIDWTEKVKIAQRNWIGKSQGATIRFQVLDSSAHADSLEQYSGDAQHKYSSSEVEKYIEVFTTRPDTLYGATFIVISPEHPFVASLLDSEQYAAISSQDEVKKYVEEVKSRAFSEKKTGLPAEALAKEGIFSGAYAINPINNQQLPIWIADYVLMGYGTGAIMAVPAHDERDFEFACKYELPIVQVVKASGVQPLTSQQNGEGLNPSIGSGTLINSGDWTGWDSSDREKILADLDKRGIGTSKTTYHLRDWLISRQRYWGPPIPMIYCDSCAMKGVSYSSSIAKRSREVKLIDKQVLDSPAKRDHSNNNGEMVGWFPVPEDQLPVRLPRIDDYKPIGDDVKTIDGKAVTSPLGNHPEFYETTCPECGGKARRETDVSDTFLDSSWYFYRYFSTDDKDHAWTPSREKAWMPVTIYTGGAEHSVLHLLYSRFLTKALKDAGLISDYDEPFPRFFAHGLIVKDGSKMSKSKGNVIVPDAYIKKFGADTLRTYLMFLGPFDAGGDFRDSGIEGMNRFMKRVWTLFSGQLVPSTVTDKSAISFMHKIIQGVTEDLETFHYNTAIAKIMTYYNFLAKKESIHQDEAQVFLQLLAPFAPHMTEELYQQIAGQQMAGKQSIHTSKWPEFDAKLIEAGEIVIAVQINGKLRATFEIESASLLQEEVEEIAGQQESVKKHLEGKTVKKVIYVPGKILNFVVS